MTLITKSRIRPPNRVRHRRSDHGRERLSTRIGLLGTCATAIVAWAAAPAAWAQDVQITRSAATSVTYTDNVDLDPDDEAEDAIIWTNTGATTVRATGARAQLAMDAALSVDTTFNDGTDVDLRPNARGFGTVELLQDRLFVDARPSAQMPLENPGSAFSASPGSGNKDLTEVYTVGVSPYLVQRFGNWASSELRYRHDRVYVGDEDTGDTVTNAASLRTDTGTRFTRVLLSNDLEYENINSDEEDDGDLERSTATLDGQYVLVRQFSPVGMIGYEKVNSDDLRDDPDGLIWNVGFIAQPGPRSRLEFRYGERYEETNIFASGNYLISPNLSFQASYTEILDITTATVGRDQFNIIVDERGRLVDTRTGLPVDLANPDFGLENEAFLAERFQASLTGTYTRDQIVLLTTLENRKFDFNPDEELFTASGQWTHDLSPDMRIGSLVAYRTDKEDSPGTTDTETVLARIQLSQDLAENLQALAAYSFAQRFADDEEDEYTENAVTLGLRLTF